MEGRLLLKGCSVFRADGRIRSGVSVLVEGSRITKVAPDAELPVLPGDWEVACRGRLVAPGLVDCHTHLVGGQLQPLVGEFLLRPFMSRFEHVLRLASLLTAGEVEALTAHAIARGLRHGITLRVEHLLAPNDVAGALSAQARVAEQLVARLIHCHANLSTNGGGLAQLEANAEHVQKFRRHPLVRGALGLYGSFACDDELLRRAGRLREEMGVGAIFHLGESEEDLMQTYTRHNRRIVPRFESFGLLGNGSVASHCRTIDRGESMKLALTRTLVALSPRSSQALDVGMAGFEAVLAHGNLIGLGTCGFGTVWEELVCGINAMLSIARGGRMVDPDGTMAQFFMGGGAEMCAMTWGAPCGTVEEGSLADLCVFDFVPAELSDSDSGATPHFLVQLSQCPVAWTIVDGRVAVREGELVAADFGQLSLDAAQALKSVWARARR
ncbi:MAG: amidohydrolase family protein [Archangiaceae bacterium]|nr:amidohydrolase family protein [Archangiaceae bacterium]